MTSSDDIDDNAHDSIEKVARYIAWRLHDVERVRWEDYPDIGEMDWDAVCDAVDALAPPAPDLHEYQEAYEHLKRRAIR